MAPPTTTTTTNGDGTTTTTTAPNPMLPPIPRWLFLVLLALEASLWPIIASDLLPAMVRLVLGALNAGIGVLTGASHPGQPVALDVGGEQPPTRGTAGPLARRRHRSHLAPLFLFVVVAFFVGCYGLSSSASVPVESGFNVAGMTQEEARTLADCDGLERSYVGTMAGGTAAGALSAAASTSVALIGNASRDATIALAATSAVLGAAVVTLDVLADWFAGRWAAHGCGEPLEPLEAEARSSDRASTVHRCRCRRERGADQDRYRALGDVGPLRHQQGDPVPSTALDSDAGRKGGVRVLR